MIRIFNRHCHTCHQQKPVRYYIHNWQKAYTFVLPFPYCNECAQGKAGLTLYEEWVRFGAIIDAIAFRNNAALS